MKINSLSLYPLSKPHCPEKAIFNCFIFRSLAITAILLNNTFMFLLFDSNIEFDPGTVLGGWPQLLFWPQNGRLDKASQSP